ncbi:nitrate reductase associated protein [Dyadobacter sp. NIV53]|uniref:nitrate reductase associated protein n=1 Tax=Dyadobacter sp. NIV53 TaxID=2861765 RepID=UPI001C879C52|nr:nitrate reductase associated protein [Dyadobacter sp. NIV53]
MKTVQVSPFFFEFESDFVNTLKCVPMIVRYKLDSCGIKLKLHEWAKFNLKDKESLAHLPCYTHHEIENYGASVRTLVHKYFGYEASLLSAVNDSWNNLNEVPAEVQQKAQEWNCTFLTLKNWIEMDTLQRFALVKLSRSGHEGKNFPIALAEFKISNPDHSNSYLY